MTTVSDFNRLLRARFINYKVKVYISASLREKERVLILQRQLLAAGHKITYDWASKVGTEEEHDIRTVAYEELKGIEDAELFIFIAPGGRGAHVELGYAIYRDIMGRRKFGAGLPIVGLDYPEDNAIAFYELDCIKWV